MSMLGWVMMGLAIWHFTIFLPDHFWGGIVGAFLGAIAGAVVVGLIIASVSHGSVHVPGEHDTTIGTVLYSAPGALIGLALTYLEGLRRSRLPFAAQR